MLVFGSLAAACAGDGAGPGAPSASGGGASVGGAALTGGSASVGGIVGAGGAMPAGGASSSGGVTPSGGDPAVGGAASGGNAPGGNLGSGAAGATGGVLSGAGGADGAGGSTAIDPDAVFASPDGDPSAPGTLEAPLALPSAIEKAAPGATIYLRGGRYSLAETLNLGASGEASNVITLSGYPSDVERPELDFSAMSENSSNRGLELSGDYWHIYGIDVRSAGDNGMFVSGSHNVIEYASFSECSDTGLQLGGGAADNLVLNCDSFFNADSSLENADGFAAKLDVGSGNRFVGCRAWNNLDDGWDGYLRPADNVSTSYEDCWAIDNGKLKDGSVGAGDGNGFKTGGSDNKDLHHNADYLRCIAAGNVADGFDHNSNRGSVTIVSSAAHDNGNNINFSSSNIAASLTIRNTISVGTLGSLSATVTAIDHNSWQNGLGATAQDFVGLDTNQLKGPRKSDGSLPDVDYLHLVPGSDLIDAGVDVGESFSGSGPDLGPFETLGG